MPCPVHVHEWPTLAVVTRDNPLVIAVSKLPLYSTIIC